MTVSHTSPAARAALRCLATAGVVLAAACADSGPAEVQPEHLLSDAPAAAVQVLDCVATVATRSVSCGAPAASGARRAIIGGQNVYVRLTSSNVVATPADGPSETPGTMEFDVTVQNLLNEGLGTPDGVVTDTAGIKVFFFDGPNVTGGSGTVWLSNQDGDGMFLGAERPFFRYDQKLAKNEVSDARRWSFNFAMGVTSFGFKVYVAAEVQPLLVINEVLANPKSDGVPIADVVADASGEWFEVYNAGRLPVQMQGMMVADSGGAGRRQYHRIISSLLVPPGGYVVLGNTTDTVSNGGVPVDYAYGNAMAFANSLDAVKIARVHNIEGDTLTIDRTAYANVPAPAPRTGPTAAQDGESRELTNPALDNGDLNGAGWAYPLSTAVYGRGGRGTPRAQNSTYTP